MIPDRPKVRGDLVISRQEVGGRVRYVVKDPQTHRYFQCGEDEIAILRLMDGSRSLEELSSACVTSLEMEVDVPVLRDFVGQLYPLGLFEVEGGHGQLLVKKAGSIGNPLMNLLFFRVGVVRPGKFLAWLDGWAGFFYTPVFVALALGTLGAGMWTLVENFDGIGRDLMAHAGLFNLILLWVVAFVMIGLHETAHGLTCTHFGGHVREMGFLLLFGLPCLYTDVSDAWLFPRRSRRLWVTLAGPFFEAFLWSLSILAWRVTAPGTGLHLVALCGVLTSGMTLILGLNPLIKLDGYYLLSDWLEVPNLRARSFSYFGRVLWRTLTGAAEVVPADVPGRQKRIFLTYAPLGLAYSTFLVTLLVLSIGAWLADLWGGVGSLLSAMIIGSLLWGPTKKMAEGTQALSKESGGFFKRWRGRIVLGLLIGAIAASAFVPMELEISGDFTLEPTATMKVSAPVAGFVKTVKVRQGDAVKAGDVIVELDTALVEADLRREEAKLEQAKEEVRRLKAPPRPEDLALAEERKKTAEVKVEFARASLERAKTLLGSGSVSQQELDEKQAALGVALGEVNEAEAALAQLKLPPKPEDVAVAQAKIKECENEVGRVKMLIERATVRATVDGVVVTERPERLLGTRVAEGDVLLDVMQVDPLVVDIAVPEGDIGEIHKGQTIALKAASQAGRTFAGTVQEIAPVVASGEKETLAPARTITVRCVVPNADGALKPGMTGRARIACGPRSVLGVFTRKFVRMIRVEFWW